MSYYYLRDKIEEIRAKDISDEEKSEEIKKLVEGIQTRRKESAKKQDRQAIAVLLVIIAIFIVSALFASLDIDFGDTKYYIGIGIFSLVGFIFFIYCISQKIKLTKKENHWKNMMKDETSELQRLCEEICNNINVDLKRKRNKIGISKLIFVLGVTLPWLLPVYLVMVHKIDVEVASLIFSLVYFVVVFKLMGIVEKAKKEYKSLYKKEVINTFVKTISSNIEYSEKETNRSRIKSNYRHCCFDNADELRYRIEAEDYCTENINSVNIEMADVVSYEHYSGRGSYDRVLFTGNFMVLNTNKEYERFEIRLNKFKLFNKKESIEIDNQIFNKYFKIYSDNNIEVQKYLTPSLIEFLADFRERYGIDFEMIFEDKIYIRFYTDNMFEPKMKGKIVDEYSVYKFYVITKFAREFVEKFER